MNIMNICKTLPFISLKSDKLENYIKEKFKNYIIELNDFILYFKQTWIKFFNNESLFLNNVNIKFRTNNSSENFNRIFKNNFNKNKNKSLAEFIDIILDEIK